MMNTYCQMLGFPHFLVAHVSKHLPFERARNGQQLSPEAASSAGNKRKAIEAVPKKGFRQWDTDPKWWQRYPPVNKDRFGKHMVPMNIIYIHGWFSISPGIFTGGYTPTTWSRLVRQIPTPWSSLEGISPYHDRFSKKYPVMDGIPWKSL